MDALHIGLHCVAACTRLHNVTVFPHADNYDSLRAIRVHATPVDNIRQTIY
jgi:hypothetical protein